MPNNKYIVKSLAPWMIDEIIAFSKLSKFDLILLRSPNLFYSEGLKEVKSNGIDVYIQPTKYNMLFKKLRISLLFVLKNLRKFGFNYNGIIGLKSLIWFLKIDLSIFSEESRIHAQFATQAPVVSLLIKEFYERKPEISFTFHAYDIYFENSWFNFLVEKSLKAFSISEFNLNYVKSNYGDFKNMELARLGVFRDEKRILFEEEKDVFRLGLISWFVEKKGVFYLLEALKNLKENGYHNIKFVLAGDGPLKEQYLEFIEKNDLGNNVDYIGKINGPAKKAFFKSLDMFILPSIKLKNDQDGIPVVLMEAIAYSLPIISTNISGIPEICINDYNGKLIRERSSIEIYNSILELYNNKEKRKEFSLNSYELSKEYDIEMNSTKKLSELGWITNQTE